MQRIEFVPDRDTELFAAVPASAAVFLLRGEDEATEPYVSKTSNLRRRLQRLLGLADGQTRKLNLRERVRWVEWTATGSDFEASFLLYQTLRHEFPKTYDKRLRLRFAPLVKLILDNPYPRATVTTRISGLKSGGGKGNSQYFGPFATRVAAEKFANDALDLFKMRRCTFDLDPDPAFPGCIYSEMKMCLAPCFKGCTDDEYAAEVGRVQQFFESGGQSLVREIERQRDEASTNLDFEAAAAMHTRLEKVKAARAQLPDIVRRLDELNGVMVQPSADRESVALFKIVGGRICAPVALNVGQPTGAAQLVSKPQSMESRISEALAAVEADQTARGTGADGAPCAAEALVLPHHKGRGTLSRRKRRAADAARGAWRVTCFSRREADWRPQRNRRRLLEIPRSRSRIAGKLGIGN